MYKIARKKGLYKPLNFDNFQVVNILLAVLISFADYEACRRAFKTENLTDLVINITLIAVMEKFLIIDKAYECGRSCRSLCHTLYSRKGRSQLV